MSTVTTTIGWNTLVRPSIKAVYPVVSPGSDPLGPVKHATMSFRIAMSRGTASSSFPVVDLTALELTITSPSCVESCRVLQSLSVSHDELCTHEPSLCNADLRFGVANMVACGCRQVAHGAVLVGEESGVLRAPELFSRRLLGGARVGRPAAAGAESGAVPGAAAAAGAAGRARRQLLLGLALAVVKQGKHGRQQLADEVFLGNVLEWPLLRCC